MGGDGIYASGFFKGAGDKGEAPPPRSASRSPSSRAPSSSSRTTRRPASRRATAPTAPSPSTRPTSSSRAWPRRSPTPRASRRPGPRSSRPSAPPRASRASPVSTFDEYGDTSNRALTVYKATGSEWVPEFSGRSRPRSQLRLLLRGVGAAPQPARHRPRGRPSDEEGAVDEFVQQLANGVTKGSYYALIALGYTMVYGIIHRSTSPTVRCSCWGRSSGSGPSTSA